MRRRSLQVSINDSFAEVEVQVNTINTVIEDIFESIFALRYRDVVSDIRVICVRELTQWLILYPEFYLKNEYLKYIGWLLNDRVIRTNQHRPQKSDTKLLWVSTRFSLSLILPRLVTLSLASSHV